MKSQMKHTFFFLMFNLMVLVVFSQQQNAFRFKLAGNGYSDETVIRLVNGASVSFDNNYDAKKFFSLNTSVPSIYTQIAVGQELSINALPEFNKDTSITIYTNIPVSGSYTLKFEEIFSLTSNYKISLSDISTSTHYRLMGDTALFFTFNAQQGSPSFTFNLSTSVQTAVTDETCYKMNDGQLQVTNAGNEDWEVEIYDATNTSVVSTTSQLVSMRFYNLLPGTYTTVIRSKGIEDRVPFTVHQADSIVADFSLDKDTVYLSDGANVYSTNTSLNANNYYWDFGDGTTYSSTNPAHSYNALGSYTVKLRSFHTKNSYCASQYSKQVVVLNTPELTTSIENKSEDQVELLNLAGGKIELNFKEPGNNHIMVYDLSGKQVYNTWTSDQRYGFSLSNNPKGMYVLNVQLANGNGAVKEMISVR